MLFCTLDYELPPPIAAALAIASSYYIPKEKRLVSKASSTEPREEHVAHERKKTAKKLKRRGHPVRIGATRVRPISRGRRGGLRWGRAAAYGHPGLKPPGERFRSECVCVPPPPPPPPAAPRRGAPPSNPREFPCIKRTGFHRFSPPRRARRASPGDRLRRRKRVAVTGD
ncbi:hypothetical protein NL676_037169 [Syzygium grande]|nr:hypothetical protein NL676_037169 [Syzygium grande]